MSERAELRARFESKGGWGEVGSQNDARYSKPWPQRRMCPWCGKKRNKTTHAGYANGLGLMSGCEFHVVMWVRNPDELLAAGATGGANP